MLATLVRARPLSAPSAAAFAALLDDAPLAEGAVGVSILSARCAKAFVAGRTPRLEPSAGDGVLLVLLRPHTPSEGGVKVSTFGQAIASTSFRARALTYGRRATSEHSGRHPAQ
jgi:hypothetical protein